MPIETSKSLTTPPSIDSIVVTKLATTTQDTKCGK